MMELISLVRIENPLDQLNIFELFLWVINTLGPLGQNLVDFIFAGWNDLAGNTYSLGTILLNPITLGFIWGLQAFKAAFL